MESIVRGLLFVDSTWGCGPQHLRRTELVLERTKRAATPVYLVGIDGSSWVSSDL